MSEAFVEGQLVEDINGEWLWKTADGQQIAVENLQDSHLRNIALFLIGFGYRKCNADNRVRIVWLRIMRLEWERRMLQRAEANRQKSANKEYDKQKELGE